MAKKRTPTAKSSITKPLAKEPVAKKSEARKATDTSQFPAVFARLKAILTPYAPRMVVAKNDTAWYYLDTKLVGKNKKPLMFAAARVGKTYVSFYLMSVYANPKFLDSMSPGLKKRMQGKACFNFATVDEPLFEELEELTQAGADWFLYGGLKKALGMQ